MTDHRTAEPINVIEVRRAKNGFVVSAWFGSAWRDPGTVRGYATYVVQSDDPAEIGKAVELMLRQHAITSDVEILPARQLP